MHRAEENEKSSALGSVAMLSVIPGSPSWPHSMLSVKNKVNPQAAIDRIGARLLTDQEARGTKTAILERRKGCDRDTWGGATASMLVLGMDSRACTCCTPELDL